MMIQSVWKNLTGLQKAKSSQLNTSGVTLNADLSQKLVTKHQCLLHSIYGQKYWDTAFFRREKGTSKEINVLKNCISTSVAKVLKCMK